MDDDEDDENNFILISTHRFTFAEKDKQLLGSLYNFHNNWKPQPRSNRPGKTTRGVW